MSLPKPLNNDAKHQYFEYDMGLMFAVPEYAKQLLAKMKEREAYLKKRRGLTKLKITNGYILTNHPKDFENYEKID